MDNKKKLEALKAFLKENNVKFVENYASRFGVTMDLKLPNLYIAVFLSNDNKEEDNQKYYANTGKQKLYRVYKPFFIRKSESQEFVIEKMQNCIFDQMMKLQKRFENANNKKNK